MNERHLPQYRRMSILAIRELGVRPYLEGADNIEWVASLNTIQEVLSIVGKEAANKVGVCRTFCVQSLGQLFNRMRIAGNIRSTPTGLISYRDEFW